jgi:hypothetical protein
MDTLDPNVVGTVSLAAGLSVAMLVVGARTKMLELRESARRCPSCRRLVRRGRVCPCAV